MSTSLAKPTSITDIIKSKAVPVLLAGNVSQEDWDAMPDDERIGCYNFFRDEQDQTTSNLDITFPRVKYPTSGAGVWAMPGPDGDTYSPTLAGVPVFKQPVRAWWPIEDSISNNPPKCSSPDGERPLDTKDKQSEYCATCPHAQFGTGKEGSGQACKARINVFLLMDGPGNELEEIPTVLSVPPSQLKTFSDYAVQLRKSNASLLSQVTIFGLKDEKSRGNISYKGLALKMGRKLSYNEMKKAREIANAFREQMERRGFVPNDEHEETPANTAGAARPSTSTVIEGKAEKVTPF